MKKTAILIIICLLLGVCTSAAAGCAAPQIKFVSEGATFATLSISDGSEVKLPAEPVRPGYAFMGWYMDEGSWEKQFTVETLKTQKITEELTVYARWEEAFVIQDGVVKDLTGAGNRAKHLIVPSEFNGQTIYKIGNSALSNSVTLRSVVVEEGVTEIDRYAFYFCSWLETAVLPDSVTTVGNAIFMGCGRLTDVRFGKNVQTFGSEIFSGCIRLTNLSIPFVGQNANGTGKTHLGYLFGTEDFLGHTGDNVPATLTTLNVTNAQFFADYTLYNCKSLTTINIEGALTDVGECSMRGCSALTKISLPDTVTEIGFNAFAQCWALDRINLPTSLTKIGAYAFYGTAIEKIDLPSTLTEIGKCAFKDCKVLGQVNFENASGWKKGDVDVAESTLSNAVTAADLIKADKKSGWKRL